MTKKGNNISKAIENSITKILEKIGNNSENIIRNSNIPNGTKKNLQEFLNACNQFIIEYESKSQALEQYYKKRKGIVEKINEAESKKISQHINYYEERDLLTKSSELNEVLLEYQKVLMSLEHCFIKVQLALAKLYNQEIKMLFVDKDESGEIILYEATPSVEFLKGNEFTNGRSLTYDFAKIKSNAFRLQAASSSLQSTGQEAYNRYEFSRQMLKDTNFLSKRSNGIIYWEKGNKHEMYWVNNKGTIAEAYAAFYVHGFVFGTNMESNIATFVKHEKYGLVSVDNTSGVFLGDTSVGDTQYHVKGLNASPASMTSLYHAIKYLYKIIDINQDYISIEPFAQALKEFVSQPGTAKQAKNVAEKYGTEIAEDIEKKLFQK